MQNSVGVPQKTRDRAAVKVRAADPVTPVHGILEARILEWAALPFSRGSSQPRDQTQVSCVAGRFLTS